jgi:hypothetical protein
MFQFFLVIKQITTKYTIIFRTGRTLASDITSVREILTSLGEATPLCTKLAKKKSRGQPD